MSSSNDVDWSQLEGFEWDEGNSEKNKKKHKVEQKECEDIFSNEPLIIFPDRTHSEREIRYGAFGITKSSRKLAVVFTIRSNKIRIISARDQNKREKYMYKT